METAQQFIESYLREKAALHVEQGRLMEPFNRKYFTEDYMKPLLDLFASRQKNPEKFTSMEISDEATQIITTDCFGKMQHRSRYHLRVSGGRWKIFKKEAECPICQNKSLNDKKECRFCGGVGWKDYQYDATSPPMK
jgi:hypothetical protein